VQLGSQRAGSQPVGARPRLPPLRALLAFEAAARHATFSQAAEELAVTPSAVSHQIQQLEDFLGVQLFRRHAGRALLTEAGHTYANEIKAAFGLIAAATNLVAPQSQTGHLVIASSPSFAAKWLQPRLPDFLRANPDVRVRLSTLSSPDDLDRDRCDIAIVYGYRPAAQNHAEPLLVERLRPLCSPGLVASLGLRVPADLARATLIHSVNALTWADYLRRIGSGGVRPGNELWLDRSTIAIDAAVAGLGVVLESELLAEQELRDGRLVAPFDDQAFGVATESYFLVRPAGFRNGTQVGKFETWLRLSIIRGAGI
jgi:LysR family transcriptional regulator, glycine cleavage system transcriptional activator